MLGHHLRQQNAPRRRFQRPADDLAVVVNEFQTAFDDRVVVDHVVVQGHFDFFNATETEHGFLFLRLFDKSAEVFHILEFAVIFLRPFLHVGFGHRLDRVQFFLGAFAFTARLVDARHGDVVQPQNHVLRRHDDRFAVRGRQDVVRGHHQNAGFQLRFQRQGNVDGHLVAVEVGVERRADQRVQLNGLAFDQNGFKSLNPQSV